MNELEYQIIFGVDVTTFNTAIKVLYGTGWTPHNNIVVDGTGKIWQMWERSMSYAKETE